MAIGGCMFRDKAIEKFREQISFLRQFVDTASCYSKEEIDNIQFKHIRTGKV